MLGAGLYRTGDLDAVLKTLVRSDAMNRAPIDAGFLALTYLALGQLENAREQLAVMRNRMRDPELDTEEGRDLLQAVEAALAK